MGIRVGIVGTGKLGREHVRIFKELEGVDFVGCYDISPRRSQEIAEAFHVSPFVSLDDLLGAVDAISVVVPTSKHSEVTLAALSRGIDVFVEKPMAATVREAEAMIAEAEAKDRILQIGHVERFNPAFLAASEYITSPSFIEIERLSPFPARSTDVSVVMDLMIHDLDLLLMILNEWPKEIRAKGAEVLSADSDIVNARLDFPCGCVANITASRISMGASRKFRIFSSSGYLSIDLRSNHVKRLSKTPDFEEKLLNMKKREGSGERISIMDMVKVDEFVAAGEEPLLMELRSFVSAVRDRSRPLVTGEEGLLVTKLAARIQDHLELESLS